MQGTPVDLSKSGVDFAELVGNNEKAENEENAERPMSRQTSRQVSRKLSRSVSTTSSVTSLNISADGSLCEVDKLDEEEEEKGFGMEASSKGKVKGSIAASYFAAGANWFWLIILGISFLVVQLLASAADYWVSIWLVSNH